MSIYIDVTFMDDTERHFKADPAWTIKIIQGVPQLVVGHGVPRSHIPLMNIKYWCIREVTENVDLSRPRI